MNFYRNTFLMGVLLLLQCQSKKLAYTANNLPQNRIVFGHGGGFSGMVKEYNVLQNGQVFEYNSLLDTFYTKKPIKQTKVADIFSAYENEHLDSFEIDDPGNLYRYIIRYKDGQSHKILWNTYNKTDYQHLNEFFDLHMKTLQPQKKKTKEL